MIKNIYKYLKNIYDKVKPYYFVGFLLMFFIGLLFHVILNIGTKYILIGWAILGTPFIIFPFVVGLLHFVIGIKLKIKKDKELNELRYKCKKHK